MSDALEQLRGEGYVILPSLLSADVVATIRAELAPHLGALGRNPFEGERTQRAYALLAKAPSVAMLVEHPEVLALVDAFLEPSYLLWGAIAINLLPGETRQAFHVDDEAGAPKRPRPPQGISTMWSLDAFDERNGATEIIPGSHAWGAGEWPAEDHPAQLCATMPAGSVLVWQGSLFHRGGANRSERARLGITLQYSQPWLRQIENMVLAVPPQKAARYSKRVRGMLGYGLMGQSFMGYVDGRNPARLFDDATDDDRKGRDFAPRVQPPR